MSLTARQQAALAHAETAQRVRQSFERVREAQRLLQQAMAELGDVPGFGQEYRRLGRLRDEVGAVYDRAQRALVQMLHAGSVRAACPSAAGPECNGSKNAH